MAHDADLGTFLRARRKALQAQTERLADFERRPDRVGRPVTQEEVAEAVDVSRTWYALLESGSVRISAALASRIATVFALDPAERHEFFRLALPDLALESSAAEGAVGSVLWPFPAGSAETLVIASPNDIEVTARALAAARERFLDGSGTLTGTRRRVLNSWLRSQAAVVDAALLAALRSCEAWTNGSAAAATSW